VKTLPEVSIHKYRLFWYLSYAYFQNKHFFNSLIARLKALLSAREDRKFKKSWEHIELKYPIFIIGPHRSGSTILQQMLCLHSEIATPRTYSDMFDMSPILSKKYFRLFAGQRGHRRIDRIITGFDSPQEAQGLIFRYFDKQRTRYNPANLDDIKHYMRKLLFLEEKSRFLWKTPYFTIRVPEVFAMFPDAKFIYLYRDPVSCVDSKLKFIEVWREISESPSFIYRHLVGKHESFELGGAGYFWERINRILNLKYLPPDPFELARDHLEWIERALMDLNNLRTSNTPCFLDYSSLIREPVASLGKLFKFLDLTDESEAIIAKLEKLGMPLRMPEAKLKYIPEDKISVIQELCQENMQRGLSGVEWKDWCVIDSRENNYGATYYSYY